MFFLYPNKKYRKFHLAPCVFGVIHSYLVFGKHFGYIFEKNKNSGEKIFFPTFLALLSGWLKSGFSLKTFKIANSPNFTTLETAKIEVPQRVNRVLG